MKTHLIALGALILAAAASAQADTLAKIRQSGSVSMGVRESSGGLSYAMGDGKYGGFHVELCERVLADIRTSLRLPALDIRYQPVTSQNRIPLLQNGTVDIECGSTTNNAARQRDVAFANTTYVEEVRVVVKADSGIASLAQLNGRKVATTTGTTSVQLLRKHERASSINFDEVFGKDHAESFLLLETGRADAFVMDGQILAASISRSKNPAGYRVLADVLAVEPIAIMVRKDDPSFKKAVDEGLAAMTKSGELSRIYDKWFVRPIPPANVAIGLPASDATRDAWTAPNSRPVEEFGKR
ncbi:MAG: hypothetical protein RJA99_1723 [Pseudomonadota bacterium]|jgi:glutamate/aspartate transport system substrate-binding protein